MKDVETQCSLYSTIITIHNGHCPKQFTGQFENAQSSSWYIYSQLQHGNT